MVRLKFTAIASAAALLAVFEPVVAPVTMADTVRNALCVLFRYDNPTPREEFTCDFTQTMGGAYVHSTRWAFIFPHAEQGKTFRRQNTVDFIRWTREGEYSLTLFQSGAKPNAFDRF